MSHLRQRAKDVTVECCCCCCEIRTNEHVIAMTEGHTVGDYVEFNVQYYVCMCRGRATPVGAYYNKSCDAVKKATTTTTTLRVVETQKSRYDHKVKRANKSKNRNKNKETISIVQATTCTHTHTLAQASQTPTCASSAAACACVCAYACACACYTACLWYANHFLKLTTRKVKESRRERERESGGEQRTCEMGPRQTTTRPLVLALPLSLCLLPKVDARFKTPAASASTSTSVLLPPSCVFGLLFWFYSFSLCMCVRVCSKRKKLLLSLFTAITSLRSIRKICYMRFYRAGFTVLVTFCRGRVASVYI